MLDKISKKYHYIKGLNGLRFILFVFIFAHHFYLFTDYSYFYNFNLNRFLDQVGNFAVTYFFMLSGFCIALGYSDKFSILHFKNYFEFIKKRFFKLYPLYIITGIICLLYFCSVYGIKKIFSFTLYFLMLQPWTVHITSGGNACAWFIAVIFFCYLITPFVLHFQYKFRQMNNSLYYYFYCFLFLILLTVLLIKCNFNADFYEYLYHFPLIRFLQYILGIQLGVIYIKNISFLNNMNKLNIKILFCIESIAVLFMPYAIMMNYKQPENIFFKTQILYLPLISLCTLYIANIKKSLLIYILESKIFHFLGSISFETYLIHYPLLIISNSILKQPHSILIALFLCITILLLTIILSCLYKKINIDKRLI